ncbi:CarD family transcriptional regulator [Olsenella sp. DSM 107455]|uniref:CarD family transcriptional regulator n=1 Tax=Thermophilibacter gallinarum TaxID=2779357 RepID=A0ABR9QRH1_9ACTN|nr:CarD family transcriptional regulator [Thermophilibacter gallinarum]MBE5023637.1 CarD family transcriptional regulator [Thermophilibacter gallinarum]
MYSVGDYLVHPGQGVCQVKDVTSGSQAVYQLLPIGKRHPVHISFPVANESRLRPVLSREEARQIIDDYPTIEVERFQARNNSLEEEHYRAEMRQGTCLDSVRVLKTFRLRIEELSARNKKPPVAYERILKEARERSCAELAVALDCTPDDVVMLFRRSMGEEPGEN